MLNSIKVMYTPASNLEMYIKDEKSVRLGFTLASRVSASRVCVVVFRWRLWAVLVAEGSVVSFLGLAFRRWSLLWSNLNNLSLGQMLTNMFHTNCQAVL